MSSPVVRFLVLPLAAAGVEETKERLSARVNDMSWPFGAKCHMESNEQDSKSDANIKAEVKHPPVYLFSQS